MFSSKRLKTVFFELFDIINFTEIFFERRRHSSSCLPLQTPLKIEYARNKIDVGTSLKIRTLEIKGESMNVATTMHVARTPIYSCKENSGRAHPTVC